MKKVLLCALALALIISVAACGRGGDNALATADTKIEVTGGNGSISVDENVVRTILDLYSPEVLGLEKDISEYTLKLGNTLVNGVDGCLIEVFDGEAQGAAAGTFALLGTDLYIHDAAAGEFILLNNISAENEHPSENSSNTAQSTAPQTTAPVTTTEPFNEEENNNAVRARFEKYDPADLGLKKAITEYVFTPVAAVAEGDDGETVYVVKIFEKDGTATGVYAAFNEEHEYSYNGALSVYERL